MGKKGKKKVMREMEVMEGRKWKEGLCVCMSG